TEGKKDPETHRLLAQICRHHKDLPLAFECLQRAFTYGPSDEENVEPFYFIGSALKRYREMVEPLKNFVLHKEDHSIAWGRLSSIHYHLGEEFLARESAEKALRIDPKNPVAKGILNRLNTAKTNSPKLEEAVVESTTGLTLDPANALAGILDSTSLVW
ncbi:MAG: hypothetical protein LBF22_15445, partial [Deltaproteobacteria bacterium]|nr:hypothetical protein [Deltaproteobacteria bacterium]